MRTKIERNERDAASPQADRSPVQHVRAGSASIDDLRPAALAQRRQNDAVNGGRRMDRQRMGAGAMQLKADGQGFAENRTGLPDQLKAGIETLSGVSMDGVKVHYNSSQPAQLNAHAYAQGADIHIAPGQERHLAHEAWHVVQQAQGRVKPTMQMRNRVLVNDDHGLEREADVMGAKALSMAVSEEASGKAVPAAVAQNSSVQRVALGIHDQFGEELDTQYMLTIHNYIAKAVQEDNGVAILLLYELLAAHDPDKLETVRKDVQGIEIVVRNRKLALARDQAAAHAPQEGPAAAGAMPAAAAVPAVAASEAVEELPSAAVSARYRVSLKDAGKTAKKIGVDSAEVLALAAWLPPNGNAAFNAFTASSETFETWQSLTCSAEELVDFMKKDDLTDWAASAVEKKKFDQLKAARSSTTARAPKKEVQFNTITRIERHWQSKGKPVATSKSGGGMLLLKGLQLSIGVASVTAHISLPPNEAGSFSEGHLKIEGGPLLNQYFFGVGSSGKLTKLANSPTVRTENPGKWESLPAEVWGEIRREVEFLASGAL